MLGSKEHAKDTRGGNYVFILVGIHCQPASHPVVTGATRGFGDLSSGRARPSLDCRSDFSKRWMFMMSFCWSRVSCSFQHAIGGAFSTRRGNPMATGPFG